MTEPLAGVGRAHEATGAGAAHGLAPKAARPEVQGRGGASFADVFRRELAAGDARPAEPPARPLVFSAHAAARMRQAGRAPSPAEVAELSAALARVAARGGRQCIAVLPDAVYLVHVPTRTVVTVVTAGRMGEGVFTGIDSAVFTGAAGLDRQAGARPPVRDANEGTDLKEAVAP
ncbi:MAG: hypothetical protein IRZ11_06395 [Clostridia bacterium]|nr:hypothetical protein [Clostridia bacterium]